jgi:hypothetical protein
MDAVRAIQKAKDDYDIKGISMFPSGLKSTVPINDKHWYPIYGKCIDLDLPVFCTTGVPGPRVPMMPQWTGHFDEFCYDFPYLKVVMRHGTEPWEELAVKLMLKWPNLYYSTSAFAPKYWPEAIIKFANSRGADKIIYGGSFPPGWNCPEYFARWMTFRSRTRCGPNSFATTRHGCWASIHSGRIRHASAGAADSQSGTELIRCTAEMSKSAAK